MRDGFSATISPFCWSAEGNETEDVVRILLRLGFDDIIGFLAGGMLSWHKSGLKSDFQPTVNVAEFCHLLDEDLSALDTGRKKRGGADEGW